ncbi:DUF2259 domain-containing protein [Breoghania sp.]|uniref:DUF2259 domain-containing protein n=1 Tax=Breoghania sp. TaxID=2065378 RepID=UPI0026124BCE|nr:DUF2259 domain-containing protein [Breoghania sp.]MDJ0931389.1 DUF2259 domain-containing protein [Breoghania sp.]
MRTGFLRAGLAVLASTALLSLATLPASAADAAHRTIIGFSPDGSHFAFEQYGIQDSSGFPYSNVFVLETASDSWVRGTPARELIRNAQATVDQARKAARKRINPFLWCLNIGVNDQTLVSDRAQDARDAARFLPFTLKDNGDELGLGTARLRLTKIAMPKADCATVSDNTHGYALVLENATGEPLHILHEDTEIPESRGCPIHYGLSDIIVFPREGQGSVPVVLISIYQFGFEGLDRRLLALSATFDKNPNEE